MTTGITLSAGHQQAFDIVKAECPPPARILDVGAFPGTLTMAMAHAGWSVTAVDIDPSRGMRVQDRFAGGDVTDKVNNETTFAEFMRRHDIATVAADVERDRLPIPEDSFDAAVLTEVMEHLWVDPLWALCELNRVLRPAGALVISTPNLVSLRNRLNFLRGRMEPVIDRPYRVFLQKRQIGHLGHLRLYAPDELTELLSALGFEVRIQYHRFNYWDGYVSPLDGDNAHIGATEASPPQRWFHTPGGFVKALEATTSNWLSDIWPPFAGHLFVSARKVRNVVVQDLSQRLS